MIDYKCITLYTKQPIMYYIIYKTTNKVTGKIYIGSHKTLNIHDGYLGSGILLSRAIKKYGTSNFVKEILHVYDNPIDMYKKEKEIVSKDFITEKTNYNIKEGGLGGWDFINSTKKNIYGNNGANGKRYIAKASRIRNDLLKQNPEYKKTYLKNLSRSIKDHYLKNGSHWLGRTHTEETKKIISEKNSINQKGSKNSQFNTHWITNGIENKKIKKDQQIPVGFYKGRVCLSKSKD